MKNRIFQNWILKLASVVCAVVLWVIIYSVNDPAESTTMYNVPVTLLNTEVVTNENQVYEVLDGSDVVRRISLQSTRSVIDNLNDGDIHVEADFSKMKLDGTIELKIYSDRHNDAITFNSSSRELKVAVEDRKERYLSLEASLTGTPENGYIVGATKLDQNRITVSGAESVVNTIDKAVAVVNIGDTSENILVYADIVLLDKNGKEIAKDKLDMSMKAVSTTVEILATKTVPVIYEQSGNAAEGYFATGEVVGAVNELLIAGQESILSKVKEIKVSGEEMSVDGAKESVVRNIDLDEYLPNNVIRASREDIGLSEVAITIVPILNRAFTIAMGQVQTVNIPEGYEIAHIFESAEMTAVVRGPEHMLNALDPSEIKGSIDITAWMEANDKQKFKNEEVLSIAGVFELGENLSVTESTPIELIVRIVE